ncbi:MAG: prepilin-type N-terminal cleavage/methylation domain-containing protein [Solobacterium sp.]|nr:prepilin-type N-terminal cleavage/methylation domain-containing protein [Solobacterium sp.]MBF1103463.1 prepilin-type N-terminal cleavage/methylation domain-containing protein [Solobacterium sp.]
MSNKGFSLLEMCVVLFVISVFMMLLPTNIHSLETEYYAFVDKYLYLQSTAMKQAISISFEEYNVRFNQKGNVNQAKTIYFKNEHTIIVELGGGRLAIQ